MALPPLSGLSAESPVAFAVVGREGRLERAGELPLHELAAVAGRLPVHAVLRAEDAIVARVAVPPVPASKLRAAVAGSVEPLVLSDLSELGLAHGPRLADGTVTVAWATRAALRRTWTLLAGAGLQVAALVPHALAIPAGDPNPDKALSPPAGPRWLAPLPPWSLALEELRPATGRRRWRRPACWVFVALLVWILGLNGYAMQVEGRLRGLEQGMRQAAARAFPSIPVIIDPLRQAMHQRDALRLARGAAADDDFVPLALATARVLEFARGHVQALQYENGELALTLAEGFLPPANESVLEQAASVQGIMLARDPAHPLVWRVRRAAVASATQGRS